MLRWPFHPSAAGLGQTAGFRRWQAGSNVIKQMLSSPAFAARPFQGYCQAVLCGMALLMAPSTGLSQCIKSVSWRNDPPYLDRQGNGVQGIHADLIRESLRRMGCAVRFVDMPFARSLVELQAGRIDIVSGVADTTERKSYAWFSRPVNNARNVLFIQSSVAGRFHIRRLQDVIGTELHLGALNQALYGGEYDVLIEDPAFRDRLTFLTTRASAWKMMGVRHLDGVIDNELAGLAEIQRDGYRKQVIESSVVLSEAPDLLAFSQKTTSADFVSRFNLAFDSVVADGTFTAIFSRYVGCEISTTKLGCK